MGVPNWTQLNPAAAGPQAILATLLAVVCAFSRPPVRILRHLHSWPVLAALFVVAVLTAPMIVIGYIAPCGAVQDTVAAGELLAGRSAYPSDLRPIIKRVVRDNPLPTTVSWLKGIQSSHLGCMYDLQLNAHPPLVAVALEPVVATMGYYKPILLFQAISLASIVLMILLWSRAFEIDLHPKHWALFLLVLFGSDPFFGVLRSAGLSALLAMLVVTVWYLLRTERNGWAGTVLAIASGLKIFPIVACGVMLFGRIRALFALALSSICIVLGIVLLHGRQIFDEFNATAHLDVRDFVWLRSNYSLFANIRYLLNGDETYLLPVVALVYGILCVIAGLALFRLRNHRTICCDFGMALAATMMCLFPPVVWTHYYMILFLPLCVLTRYSRWWESKAESILFLLILATVDGLPVEKLSALVHTDTVSSLPPLAVLAIFSWLCMGALRVPLTTDIESDAMMANRAVPTLEGRLPG